MILETCDAISIKIFNWICLKIIACFVVIGLIFFSLLDGKIDIKEVLNYKDEFMADIRKDYIHDKQK